MNTTNGRVPDVVQLLLPQDKLKLPVCDIYLSQVKKRGVLKHWVTDDCNPLLENPPFLLLTQMNATIVAVCPAALCLPQLAPL